MKKSFIILIFILSIKSAFGKCASGGFQFYPEQREISMNSMFIIEGYANSQALIVEFYKENIFLLSENGEAIELVLQKILKGQMELTQAVFKPIKELKPNTIYYLKNPVNTSGYFTQWNSNVEKMEKVHWITSDKKVNDSINSNLKIEFEKTEVIYLGCGPATNAIFNIKNHSDSEIWYKTEVVNLTNNKTIIYYIKDLNGKLNVGHGMCAGAFTFDKTSKYKVRFTPTNIDGAILNDTEWLTFDSPYLKEG